MLFDGSRSGKGCMTGYDGTGPFKSSGNDNFCRTSTSSSNTRGRVRNKVKYQYDGHWRNDKPHGYGVHKNFQSGDRYEGNYVDGQRHGLGVFLWANGDKYTGNFAQGGLNVNFFVTVVDWWVVRQASCTDWGASNGHRGTSIMDVGDR
jgi:hypothetical protein